MTPALASQPTALAEPCPGSSAPLPVPRTDSRVPHAWFELARELPAAVAKVVLVALVYGEVRAGRLGANRRTLARAVDLGALARVERGRYRAPDDVADRSPGWTHVPVAVVESWMALQAAPFALCALAWRETHGWSRLACPLPSERGWLRHADRRWPVRAWSGRRNRIRAAVEAAVRAGVLRAWTADDGRTWLQCVVAPSRDKQRPEMVPAMSPDDPGETSPDGATTKVPDIQNKTETEGPPPAPAAAPRSELALFWNALEWGAELLLKTERRERQERERGRRHLENERRTGPDGWMYDKKRHAEIAATPSGAFTRARAALGVGDVQGGRR